MSVYQQGQYWYYEFLWEGFRVRRSCGKGCKTKTRALQIEREARVKIMADGDAPRRTAPLLKEFAQEFLDHVDKRFAAGSLRPKSRDMYHNGCRLLAATSIWRQRISHINKAGAAELIFPGSGWNANHALRTLRALLGYAEDLNLIRSAPHIGLRAVEGRERLFAPWEEALVLEHAAPVLSDILLIMFNCGMRPDEVCRMRWEDIDWTENRILIQRGKSKGARRHVGITARMREVLMARQPSRPGDYMFASSRSGNGHITWLSQMWARTLERIAATGAELAPGLVPYSARHTYATNYLKAGGDVGQLSRLMGHTDIRTTMKYVHLVEASDSARLMDTHNEGKLRIVRKRA